MSFHETNSAGLRRRIATGERVIARQRALIKRLKEKELAVDGADRLLRIMLDTQQVLLDRAARLQRQALRDKNNLGR